MTTSNVHIVELRRRIENRFSIDTRDMSMGDWLCQNTTLRGRPFSFDRYPFQRTIADDMHPNMDVIKPSQVGLSEIQVRKSLGFVARNAGTTLIFTMPNEKMFKRMSTTRIKPLVEEEKAFNLETRTGDKPSRSMGLYQIGTSFMFVTGATEGDATSIAADAVMNDETDITDPHMLALFGSRLQNSDWKISQRFSTPSFASFGVDRGFQASDQREYLCMCTACRHHQAPTFNLNFVEIPGLSADVNSLLEIDTAMIDLGKIDLVNAFIKCERCGAPLDLGSEGHREWVAKYPSRDHARGYRVSPFSTNRLSVQYVVTQMLKYRADDYIRGWYNTVLGEAHTDSNSRLSEADIAACFTGVQDVPPIDPNLPTWLGIDMGLICHVLVGQGLNAMDMHVVRFVEVPVENLIGFVEEMLETYSVIGGAVDRHPYTPTANALYEISNGRIVPVEYRGQKELNLIKDQVSGEVIYAQANRTILIDDVVRAIRRKKIRFSGYGSLKATITEHFRDMVRDESPETEAKWVKLTGTDHFFHAAGFLMTGMKLKETETGLISDQRTSALIGAANVPAAEGNIFGHRPKGREQQFSSIG